MIRRSRQLYSDTVTDWFTGYVDHRILGAATYQTDYQVLIRVYRGYGQNSGRNLYIPASEIRSDFSDIRFVGHDGRVLQYLIETTGTNYADMWVKIPTIPTTGTVIRVVWGGGSILSASTGSAALLFDDFNTLDASVWSNTGGYGTTTNNSKSCLQKTASTNHDSSAYMYKSWTNADIAMRLIVRNSNTLDYRGGPIFRDTSGIYSCCYCDPEAVLSLHTFNANGTFNSTPAASAGNTAMPTEKWYIYEYTNVTQFHSANIYDPDTLTSLNSVSYAGNWDFYGIGFHFYDQYSPIDTFMVRKYANPEPAHGWWGPLEDL